MSRARLEARTEAVLHHGHAILEGYQHAFSHHGRDRTAKGNIELAEYAQVHGVVYQLSPQQFELLHPYEAGYNLIEESVLVNKTGELLVATTYTSIEVTREILPSDEYFSHYERGMEENGFPAHYVDLIRKQAKQ